MAVVFSGIGSCIPNKMVGREAFSKISFFDREGNEILQEPEEILEKFEAITGIYKRRYAEDDQVSSDLGTIAAKKAITNAGINPENISGIICAHNYGDIPFGTFQSDMVPSLASRIKHNLGIQHNNCITFDLVAGCPGWLQSVIVAKQFIDNNPDLNFLVVSNETLSRVVDPHDRDSMLYADGAGAVIMAHTHHSNDSGILSYATQSFTEQELNYLFLGSSYNADLAQDRGYIKMYGRKIYEFALKQVPLAMFHCLESANLTITDLKMVLLHQANEKMDEAILKRFYKQYHIHKIPDYKMPMSIAQLGNSSVATLPTLMDLILQGEIEGYQLEKGDNILLASVGAGMNINAITYRI